MSKNLKYGIKISLLSEEDGGGYLVEVPDLPGCITDGDTVEEAISKAKEAIETWIETAKKMGKPIPEPSSYINENDYSGKLTVRMPKILHKELAEVAEEQGVSLNQLIIYYLSKSIGKEMAVTASTETFMMREEKFIIHKTVADDNNLWQKINDRPELLAERLKNSRGLKNL